MTLRLTCLVALLAFLPPLGPAPRAAPNDIERRVEDLLGRMTLQEKVGQLHLVSNDVDFPREQVAAGRVGAVSNFTDPRQIAELLELKTNAVEVALHRALARLRGHLEQPDEQPLAERTSP